MNEAPPIEPAIEPAPEARQPLGWVLLALLFGLLLFGSVFALFQRGKSSTAEYMQDQVVLRSAMSQKALFTMLPASGTLPATKQIEQSLVKRARELEPKAREDTFAAILVLVMLHEAGQPASQVAIRRLQDSTTQTARAVRGIYSSKSLKPERVRQLTEMLPDAPLVFAIAKVHARELGGVQPSGRDRIAPAWKAVGFMVTSLVVIGVSLAGVIVWIAFFTKRKNGSLAPAGLPTGVPSPIDSDRMAWRMLQVLGAYVLLLFVAQSPSIPGTIRSLIPSVGILLFVLLIHKTPVLGKSLSLASLGVHREHLGRNVLWGVLGFCAEFPVALLMGLIGRFLFPFLPPPEHPATTRLMDSPDLVAVLSLLFLGAIIAPFWEEIAFRGLLFPALTRWMPLAGAVALSSFLFAGIHPQGPILWMALGTVAAVSCGLAYYTRSLVPSIVMHAMHNGLLMLMTVLAF